MTIWLIVILGAIIGGLYCCLIVASDYDDMMGYDDDYTGKEK